MEILVAYAGLAALLYTIARIRQSASEQRAKHFRLLAYILELRDVTLSTGALTDRFEEVVALTPHLGRERLKKLRDDGVKYSGLLALEMLAEFEHQVPALRRRLGHTPLSMEDHARLDHSFEALYGGKNEGKWVNSDNPQFVPLRLTLLNTGRGSSEAPRT